MLVSSAFFLHSLVIKSFFVDAAIFVASVEYCTMMWKSIEAISFIVVICFICFGSGYICCCIFHLMHLLHRYALGYTLLH